MADPPKVRTRHGELSLEEVAGALPGTGEVMASVSHCYAMCWHSALGGNWELSAYYLRRTRSLLRGLAVTRPKYASQLDEFDIANLEPLYQSVLANDIATFKACFQQAADRANAYHAETGHPYIRWLVPANPPDSGLDLTSEA